MATSVVAQQMVETADEHDEGVKYDVESVLRRLRENWIRLGCFILARFDCLVN